MVTPEQTADSTSPSTAHTKPDLPPVNTLMLGIVFGIVFGFLLQKGGAAKYHVLIGQLLLQDFTVLKIMMSAVVVGALGIHFMHRVGLVEMHIKPTRYASNIIGGLVFGVGFALAAYCPGTGFNSSTDASLAEPIATASRPPAKQHTISGFLKYFSWRRCSDAIEKMRRPTRCE